MRRISRWLAVLALLAPAAGHAATAPQLAVVLAIDVSASVDADSFILQRDGIAAAFRDPRLVGAIALLPSGIEAMLLEWSDPEADAAAVDWRHVADPKSAAAFAAAVHAARRSSRGRTAIGPALLAAAKEFDRLPQAPPRRVIDISGDGMANLGGAPERARDRIVAAGITINGLAILAGDLWLEDYYRHNVIGGAGAFVVAAQSYASFAKAMRRKLQAEVAVAGSPRLAQMQ